MHFCSLLAPVFQQVSCKRVLHEVANQWSTEAFTLSVQVHRPKEVPSNCLCALLNCGLGTFAPTQAPFSFLCKLVSDFLPTVTFHSISLSQFAGFSFSLPSPQLSVSVSNYVSLVILACFFPDYILLFFPPLIHISLSLFCSQSFLRSLSAALHLSCSIDLRLCFPSCLAHPQPHAVPTSCLLLCVQQWAVNTH